MVVDIGRAERMAELVELSRQKEKGGQVAHPVAQQLHRPGARTFVFVRPMPLPSVGLTLIGGCRFSIATDNSRLSGLI
jgi:hypothetical protein